MEPTTTSLASPSSSTSRVGPPRLTQLYHLYATGLQSSNDYVGGLQGREALSNINRAILTNNRILDSLMVQHANQMNVWEKKRVALARAKEQQQIMIIQNAAASSTSVAAAASLLEEAPPMWLPATTTSSDSLANTTNNGAGEATMMMGGSGRGGAPPMDTNDVSEGGSINKISEEKRLRDIAESSAASILTTSISKAAAMKNKPPIQPAKIVATDALSVAQNSADAQWVLLVQKSPLHRISADEIEHIRTEWFVIAAQKSRNDNWRIQLKSKLESAGIMDLPTRHANKGGGVEDMTTIMLLLRSASTTDVNGYDVTDGGGGGGDDDAGSLRNDEQQQQGHHNNNNNQNNEDSCERPFSPLLPLTSETSPPRFLTKGGGGGGSNFHQKKDSGWVSDAESKQKHKPRSISPQSPTRATTSESTAAAAVRSPKNSPTTRTPTTTTSNITSNTWGTTAPIPDEILREVLAYQNCFQTAKDDEEEVEEEGGIDGGHNKDALGNEDDATHPLGRRGGGGITLASLSFDSSSAAPPPPTINDDDVKTKEDLDAEALAARQKLPPTVPQHIYQSLPYFQSEITMGEFSLLLKDFLIRSGTFNEKGMKRSYQQLLEQVKRQRSNDNNQKNSTTAASMSKSGALVYGASATIGGRGVHFGGEESAQLTSNSNHHHNNNGLEMLSSGFFTTKDAAAAASSSIQFQHSLGSGGGVGKSTNNTSSTFEKSKKLGESSNNNIEQQRTGIKRSTELAGYLKDVFESIDKLCGNDILTENEEFTNNNDSGGGGGKGGGSKGTVNWDQFLTYLLAHVYDISPDQWSSTPSTSKTTASTRKQHQAAASSPQKSGGDVSNMSSAVVVVAGRDQQQNDPTNLHLPLQQRILISALSGVGVSDYVIESIRSGMGMTATDVPPQILARVARHGGIKALKAVKRALGGPPSFEVLGITRKKLLTTDHPTTTTTEDDGQQQQQDFYSTSTSSKKNHMNNNSSATSGRKKAAASSGLEATSIMKPDLQFKGQYNTTVPRSGIHAFMKMEFFDHWRAIVALDNKTAAIFLTEDVAVWGQQPGTPNAMLTAAGEVVDDDVSGGGAATSGFSAKVHVTGACDDPHDTQPGTTSHRRGPATSTSSQQQADHNNNNSSMKEGFAFVDDDVPGGAKYLHFDGKVLACELLSRSKLLVFSCASRAQLYIFMVGHNRHTVRLLSHCAVPLLPLEYHESTERYRRLQLQRKQQTHQQLVGGGINNTTAATSTMMPTTSMRINISSTCPTTLTNNNLSSSVVGNVVEGGPGDTDTVDVDVTTYNNDDGVDTVYESQLIAQYNAIITPVAAPVDNNKMEDDDEDADMMISAMMGGEDEDVGKSRGIARRHECAILKERRAMELRQMREARGGLQPQRLGALTSSPGGGQHSADTHHTSRHLPGTTSTHHHLPPPPAPMPTASSTATITCIRVWRDREGTITGMGHGGGAATYILLGGTREGIFFGLSLLDSEALRRGNVKDTRKDKHGGGSTSSSKHHQPSSETGGSGNSGSSTTAASSTGSLPVGPKILFQYPVHKGAITDILVLPKSNRVVTCGLDGKLYSHYPNGANIMSQDRSGSGAGGGDDVDQDDENSSHHNTSQIHGDWGRTRHTYVGGHQRAITSLAVVGADALGATSSSSTALSTSNSKSGGGGGGDVFVSAGVEYNIYCWADTMPRPLLVLSDPFSTPHRHAIVRVMGVEHTSTIYSVDSSGLVKLFNVNSGRCIGTWKSTSVARGHNNSNSNTTSGGNNNNGGDDDDEDGESAEGMNTGGNNIAPLSSSSTKGVYGVRKGGGNAKSSLFSTSNSTKAMMASSIAVGPTATGGGNGSGGGGARGGGGMMNSEMPSVFSACFTGSTHRTLLLGSDILRRFHTEKRDINASKATSTSDPILAIGVGLGASVGFKESSHFSVIVTVCARNFTTWSGRTGMRIQVVDTDTFSPAWTTAAAMDGGCGHVVVGKATGVVEVFDVHTGNMSRRYSFHTSRITSVALDSVAGLIFTSSTAGDMCVWHNVDFKTHSHFLGAGSDAGILRVKRAHYSKLKQQQQNDNHTTGNALGQQQPGTTTIATDMASIGHLRVAPVAPITTAVYDKSSPVGLGELGRGSRATAALTNTTLNTSTIFVPNQQPSSSTPPVAQLYQEPETSYLRPIRLLSQAAWLTGHLYFTLGALRGKELTTWEKKQQLQEHNQRRNKSSDFGPALFGESPLSMRGGAKRLPPHASSIVSPPLFLRNTPRTATVLDLLHSCNNNNNPTSSYYDSSPFSQESNNSNSSGLLKPLIRQYAGIVAYLPGISQNLFTEGQNARKAKELLRQQQLDQAAATFAPSRVTTPSSRRKAESTPTSIVRKNNNSNHNNNNNSGKALLKEAKHANEQASSSTSTTTTSSSTPPLTATSRVEKKLSQFKASQEIILEDRAVLCRRAQLAWWVYNRWRRNFMAQNTRRRGEDADSGARVVYRPIVSVQLATASGGYSAKQICVHPGSMRAVVMSQCNLVTVVDYAWIGSRALYHARHQHRMEVLRRCIQVREMEAAVGTQWESGISGGGAASMSVGTTTPSAAALQRKLRNTRRLSRLSPQADSLQSGGLSGVFSPPGSTPGNRRFSIGFGGGGEDSPGGGAISNTLDNLESLERLMQQGVGGGPATTQQQRGIIGDDDDDETRLFALPSSSPILQPPPIQVVCVKSSSSSAPLNGNYHQRRRSSSIFTKPNVGLQNSTNTTNGGAGGSGSNSPPTNGVFAGLFGGGGSSNNTYSSDEDEHYTSSNNNRGDYSLHRFGPSTHIIMIPHRNVSSSSSSSISAQKKGGGSGKHSGSMSMSMSKTVGIHSLGLSTLNTTTSQQRGGGGANGSVVSTITTTQQQLAEFSQLEIAAVCFGGSSHIIFTADNRGYIYLWVLRFDQERRADDMDPIADADQHFTEELSSALEAAGFDDDVEATKSFTSTPSNKLGNTTTTSQMLDRGGGMSPHSVNNYHPNGNNNPPQSSAARASRLEVESRYSVEYSVVHERSFCTPMLLVCFKAVETRAERDVSVAGHRGKVTRRAARKYERRKARKAEELERVTSAFTSATGGDPRKSIHHPKNSAAVFGVPNDYCISTSEEDFDKYNSDDSSSISSDENYYNSNVGGGGGINQTSSTSRASFADESSPHTLPQQLSQGRNNNQNATTTTTVTNSSRISTARSNPSGHPPDMGGGGISSASPSLLLARITCMAFDLGRFTLLVGDDGGDVRLFEIEPCFTSYPRYDPLVAAGAHHPPPDTDTNQQAPASVIKSKDAPKKKKAYAHLQKLNLRRGGGAASVPVGCPPRHVATIRSSDAPISIVVGLAGVADAGTAMPVSLFGHMTVANGPLETGISAQTLLETIDPATFLPASSTTTTTPSTSEDKLRKSVNSTTPKKSSSSVGTFDHMGTSSSPLTTTEEATPSSTHIAITQLELYPARTTSALQGICTVSGSGVVQWASYAGDVVATLRRGPVVNRTWSLGCGAVYLEGEQPPQDGGGGAGAGGASSPMGTSSAPNWLIERVGVVGLRWWKLTAAVANGREWTETAWRILSQIQGDHNPRAATPAVTRALGRLKLLMRSRPTPSQSSTPGTRDRLNGGNSSIPLPCVQGRNIVPSLHTILTAHCIMSYEFRWVKPGIGGDATTHSSSSAAGGGSNPLTSSSGGSIMKGRVGSKPSNTSSPTKSRTTTPSSKDTTTTSATEPKTVVHPDHPDAVLAMMLKLAPAPPIVHPELLSWFIQGDAWCPKRIRRRERRRKQQQHSEAVAATTSSGVGIFSDKNSATTTTRGNSIIGVGRKATLPNITTSTTTTAVRSIQQHRGSSFAQYTPPQQQLLRPSTAAGEATPTTASPTNDYLLVRPDDDPFFADTEGGGGGQGQQKQQHSPPATFASLGDQGGDGHIGSDHNEDDNDEPQSGILFGGSESGPPQSTANSGASSSKRPVILSHQPVSAPKMKCKLGRSGYVGSGGDVSTSGGASSSPLGFGKGKRNPYHITNSSSDPVGGDDNSSSFINNSSSASASAAAGTVVLPPLSGSPVVMVALHPLLQQLDSAVLVSANRPSDLQQRVIVDSRIRLQTKPEQHRPIGPPPNATKQIWVPSASTATSIHNATNTTASVSSTIRKSLATNHSSSRNSSSNITNVVVEEEPLRAFLLKDYDEGDETRPAPDYSIPTRRTPSRQQQGGGGSRSVSPSGGGRGGAAAAGSGSTTPISPKRNTNVSQEAEKLRPAPSPGRETTEWYSKLIVPSNTRGGSRCTDDRSSRRATTSSINLNTTTPSSSSAVEELSSRVVDARAQIRRPAAGTGRMTHRQLKDLTSPNRILRATATTTPTTTTRQQPIGAPPAVLQPRGEVRLAGVGTMSLGGSSK